MTNFPILRCMKILHIDRRTCKRLNNSIYGDLMVPSSLIIIDKSTKTLHKKKCCCLFNCDAPSTNSSIFYIFFMPLRVTMALQILDTSICFRLQKKTLTTQSFTDAENWTKRIKKKKKFFSFHHFCHALLATAVSWWRVRVNSRQTNAFFFFFDFASFDACFATKYEEKKINNTEVVSENTNERKCAVNCIQLRWIRAHSKAEKNCTRCTHKSNNNKCNCTSTIRRLLQLNYL